MLRKVKASASTLMAAYMKATGKLAAGEPQSCPVKLFQSDSSDFLSSESGTPRLGRVIAAARNDTIQPLEHSQ